MRAIWLAYMAGEGTREFTIDTIELNILNFNLTLSS